MGEDLNAFVIMPFDPEFEQIFHQVIKPALEDAGYDVKRADSDLHQQNIMRDIVSGIANAALVVADLTAAKANVMYELGLCHGLRRPTIMITQSMEDVPFDLRGYRTQVYSTHFEKMPRLRHFLQDIASRHARGEVQFGSPITEYFQMKERAVQVDGWRAPPPSEGQLEKPVEDAVRRGFLDIFVDAEASVEEMVATTEELTKQTEEIGSRIEGHANKMREISSTIDAPGTARALHKVVSTTAADMSEYAAHVEKAHGKLDSGTDAIIEMMSLFVNVADPVTMETDRTRAFEFRGSVSAMLDGTRGGLEGVRSFRDIVADLSKMGISRAISSASRRLSGALDDIVSDFEKLEAFCVRALALIDERFGDSNEAWAADDS